MPIILNRRGFEHAKRLIREERVRVDERGDWKDHRPSADEERAFIAEHGMETYGDWHLGVNDEESERSGARYHYLFGDFVDVHRCALFDAEDSADDFFYGDIELAVAELMGMAEAHATAAVRS